MFTKRPGRFALALADASAMLAGVVVLILAVAGWLVPLFIGHETAVIRTSEPTEPGVRQSILLDRTGVVVCEGAIAIGRSQSTTEIVILQPDHVGKNETLDRFLVAPARAHIHATALDPTRSSFLGFQAGSYRNAHVSADRVRLSLWLPFLLVIGYVAVRVIVLKRRNPRSIVNSEADHAARRAAASGSARASSYFPAGSSRPPH